ncbi:kinectin [Trichonephila clavipes]|nr:kinectin [Trichonephila clavipes]
MEEMHHLARERIGMASEKMKTQYDARATGHDFNEGDQVWLWNPKRRKGLFPKLKTNWEGPYTVLVVVRIQKSPHSKPKSHTPGLALHTTVTGKCPSSSEDEQEKQGESRDSNEFRSKDGTVVKIPDADFNIVPKSVTRNTTPCSTRIRSVNNQGLIGYVIYYFECQLSE